MRIARDTSFILRWVSLFFIAAAIILTMIELTAYSRARSNYPDGMTIGGVPVGGISPQEAAQRLLQVYSSPIEIQYAGELIHLDPTLVGFSIETEAMLAAADLQRTGSPFWIGFWDFLWSRQPQTSPVPLVATFSQEQLTRYLREEISPRYDIPAVAAQPVPGQVNFAPGTPGQEVDINRAVILIEDALRSPGKRTVALTAQRTLAGRPVLNNLGILVRQIIDLTPFDGVVGFYMLDLQTGEELHFGYNRNENISITPDIAFTASSTIKIPVMISTYNYLGPELSDEVAALVLEMVTMSENPATDALMRRIDEARGPLVTTSDLQSLGLDNTFIAGYFFNGAPLLQRFETEANQRTDVVTNPDVYNQTTPSEMGQLLADIYQCSQTGGGALVAAFPDKMSQQTCLEMVDYLKRDRIGVLLEAGLPDGTQIAHKHGWISGSAGIIQNISDAGIVYTPGGNYVISIYIYHPVQTIWEPVSNMVVQISQAVYNYFNLPSQ
ncbi:MAG: class A beta-lactamase-related serine hydrolase [Anaerolineae bacterium]|nr:class A beta-lactamase-related serine hydrolase [Anaerolineae bacterium]